MIPTIKDKSLPMIYKQLIKNFTKYKCETTHFMFISNDGIFIRTKSSAINKHTSNSDLKYVRL